MVKAYFSAVLVIAVGLIGGVRGQDKKEPEDNRRKVTYWEIDLYETKDGRATDLWGPYDTKVEAEEGKRRALALTYLGSTKLRWQKAEIVERTGYAQDAKPDRGDKQPETIRTLTLDMPGGKKFELPLSNVDPKPITGAKPPIVDLVGKKAEGKVGDRKATFEFQKDNKLVIGGEVKGKGKWELSEEKLTMATDGEVFFGAVEKDGKMKGKRVKRDGKELREWNAAIARALRGSMWKGTATDETVFGMGTSKGKTEKRVTEGTTLTFDDDGSVQFKMTPSSTYKYKYRETDKGIELLTDEKVVFVLTVSGNTMSHTGAWSKPTEANGFNSYRFSYEWKRVDEK